VRILHPSNLWKEVADFQVTGIIKPLGREAVKNPADPML
jgi:hypothetical protein